MYELLDEWESCVGNFLIFDFEFWILENQNPDFCFGDECVKAKRLDKRDDNILYWRDVQLSILQHFTMLK